MFYMRFAHETPFGYVFTFNIRGVDVAIEIEEKNYQEALASAFAKAKHQAQT